LNFINFKNLPFCIALFKLVYHQADENLNEDLIQFLHSQSRPVVIMHHETPTAAHFIQRNLASAYGNGGNGMGNTTLVKPLDEYQISQYQVNQF
jgi:hypothetical protein